MDVNVENLDLFGRKLSVTIPDAEVTRAFDEVTREVGKEARLPGFRPGKVPKDVILQHYGKRIQEEVRERLVSDSLIAALQEKEINPVGRPRLQLGELTRGTSFSYTAEFQTQPAIAITSYKGLTVPELKIEIAEKDIDEDLERLREQATQLVPVLIRDTAEKGDVVVADYVGTMGGVPISSGQAENALIEVGAPGYLPEISDGLVGAKVPGERIIEVDFPADYPARELAGKPATFRVTLKELKKKELPALDDEFARDMGEESLASLRDKVKQSIELRKRKEAEQDQRKALLEALVLANPFDLAPELVEQQAERMVESAQARVQQMVGRKVELGAEERASILAENKTNAELQVRSGLLLFEIAKAEQVHIEDEEIETEIEALAESFGADAPRVKSYYRDPEHKERIRYRLLEDKVVKLLLACAEIKSTAPTA